MSSKIKKILFATDLSVNSAHVFRYALNVAETYDATIDVLHVLRPHIKYVIPAHVMGLTDSAGDVKYEGEKTSIAIVTKIKKTLDDFVQEGIKDNLANINRVSSIQMADGNPVLAILRKADELNADVLIMGASSKEDAPIEWIPIMGTRSEVFVSTISPYSITANVMQRSRIPVFLIPAPKA